jgi:hypothetical protein
MWRTEAGGVIAWSDRQQTLLELNNSCWSGVDGLASTAACGPARWWTPQRLLSVLTLMAWGKGQTLIDRFNLARQALGKGGAKTFQGMIKAFNYTGPKLIHDAIRELQKQVQTVADKVCGWVVFAVDGSRFDLCRTQSHAEAMGKCSKAGSGPQMGLTVLWHMGAQLPWDWRIGPGDFSERAHLEEMIDSMPAGSLCVTDPGFSGYGVMTRIVQGGKHFLIRLGSNTTLLKELGHGVEVRDTVYLWPSHAQQDKQPPLVARLIRLPLAAKPQNRRRGKRQRQAPRRWMYLLTSVLDQSLLSDHSAGMIYRMRWGIECCYRTLKQTMDARKLRSRIPDNATLEINGLIMGLVMLGLLTQKAILAGGGNARRWSPAQALRIVQHGLRRPKAIRLWNRFLAKALIDDYRRKHKTRVEWARKKRHDPVPSPPKRVKANKSQCELAQSIWSSL